MPLISLSLTLLLQDIFLGLTMLAGIKTGKKKKRKISKDVERSDNVNIQPDQIGESLPGSNQSAADELKHLFGQRRRGGTTATAVAPVAATKTPISRSDSLLPYERIGKRLGKEIVRSDNNETIVLTGEAAKADSSRPEYEKGRDWGFSSQSIRMIVFVLFWHQIVLSHN